MNEITSSSFEFYEGLRALVPGALALGLYVAIADTFGLGPHVDHSVLIAFLVTLAVGFVLLLLDVPARAAVFQYDTPERFLRSWTDLSPRGGTSHLNIYYEILDVEVPPGVRTKIYYFGVIYRIGFELIYLAAVAIPVLLIAISFPSVGETRGQTSTDALQWVFAGALVAHGMVVATALSSRYGQHRDKENPQEPRRRRQRWQEVLKDLDQEIPTVDRVLLLAGLLALVVGLLLNWSLAAVGAVAISGIVWTTRYFYGVKSPTGSGRRNLHAVTAAAIYGLSCMSLCASGVRWAASESPLDARVVVGWVLVSLVGAALVSVRAHERKLLGSYATQRTWLAGKRDTLVTKGYFVSNDRPAAT